MSTKHLDHCLSEPVTYDILDDFRVTVDVASKPSGLALDSLFAMAARRNRRRGFLFVSKVLGKHIPVNPFIPLVGGLSLAAGYLKTMGGSPGDYLAAATGALGQPAQAAEVWQMAMSRPLELPTPTTFIGFAETATALGYSVFGSFAQGASYIHTTRENILSWPAILSFREEHSHAAEHRCYLLQEDFLRAPHPIALVDDEITTGATALNLIKEIQARFPRRDYAVLSLLDWRSAADRARFAAMEQALGIRIRTFALVTGTVRISGASRAETEGSGPAGDSSHSAWLTGTNPGSGQKSAADPDVRKIYLSLEDGDLLPCVSADSGGVINQAPYGRLTGRFGIAGAERAKMEEMAGRIGNELRRHRHGRRALCLGTGEFMYLPLRIAAHLGEEVSFHATTRSPVVPDRRAGYAVHNGYMFAGPEDPAIPNYLYNVPPDYYDELFIFLERDVPEQRLQPLYSVLTRLGVPRVYVVVCGPQGPAAEVAF